MLMIAMRSWGGAVSTSRGEPGDRARRAHRRLNRLVEEGILERVRYSERPERHDYLLTEKGRGPNVALTALRQWGDEYAADRPPRDLWRWSDGTPVRAALVPTTPTLRADEVELVRRPASATGRDAGGARVIPVAVGRRLIAVRPRRAALGGRRPRPAGTDQDEARGPPRRHVSVTVASDAPRLVVPSPARGAATPATAYCARPISAEPRRRCPDGPTTPGRGRRPARSTQLANMPAAGLQRDQVEVAQADDDEADPATRSRLSRSRSVAAGRSAAAGARSPACRRSSGARPGRTARRRAEASHRTRPGSTNVAVATYATSAAIVRPIVTVQPRKRRWRQPQDVAPVVRASPAFATPPDGSREEHRGRDEEHGGAGAPIAGRSVPTR